MPKRPISLNAGALLLALLLAIIVGVVTAGLLLLLQYHRQYALQGIRQERLQQNLASATNLLLTRETAETTDTLRLSLFDGALDSVILIQKPWGVFDVGIAHAFEQRDTLSHSFLIGRVPTDQERYALYLADEHRPLSISGDTRIRGDALLPEAGIRKSYIENQAYSGEEVVYEGTIQHSQTNLPSLHPGIIDRLAAFLQADAPWFGEATDVSIGYANDALHRPFSGPRQILYSQDSITLGGPPISGQVIVVAQVAITVPATAQLNDVLLFAPSIRFDAGFRGRLQAFASDSLIVAEGCTFDYPSALGLVNTSKEGVMHEFQPVVNIDSASVVNGLVFSHFPSGEQLLASIRLASETTINGQVYADGLLELQGTVHGITLCRRFTLQTPSSLYENFVLGGVMDYTRLSPHYAGSPLLNTGRLGRVLKWLDRQTGE